MFRFLYAIFALFVLIMVLLVLIKTDLSGFINTFSRLSRSGKLQAEQLSDAVIRDDVKLRSLAQRLVKGCPDIECQAYSLFNYLLSEYRIDNSLKWNELTSSPERLIRTNSGSGMDLNVLLSSLMESINIPTRIIITDGFSYISACGLSRYGIYRLIVDDQYKNMPPVLKDKFRLAAGQVWVALPELDEKGENVTIKILSDTTINMYLFHSKKEVIFDGDNKNYFPECLVKSKSGILEKCFMEPGNLLAVMANDKDATVEIALYRDIIGEDDIAVQNFDGEDCIPFAFLTDKGWFTPAMDKSEIKEAVFNPRR